MTKCGPVWLPASQSQEEIEGGAAADESPDKRVGRNTSDLRPQPPHYLSNSGVRGAAWRSFVLHINKDWD